jgi:hypothetical protein
MWQKVQHSVLTTSARGTRLCLSCGNALPSRRRRYCAQNCRQQLMGSLNRRTGLLRALNTRYATFYFTEFIVVMDLLPYGTKQIYSYMLPRSPGKKPVDDFCELSNMLGTVWWDTKNKTKKRYLASQYVLDKAAKSNAPKEAVIPSVLTVPSVRKDSLISLELRSSDLTLNNLKERIQRAYRRQVKIHHPDLGGSAQAFIKIHEAYEKLIMWAKNPTFVHRSGFPDKWLYQGESNRWGYPILLKK